MIRLGPSSPLLTPKGARRKLQASEEDQQIALCDLVLGPCVPGVPRQRGGGMTLRYPELFLLYAIPNGGWRSKKTAGRLKAQGVRASMPDMCLPVPRGPFHSLYIEFKVAGRYGSKDQRQMADDLRAQGHCVVECQGIEEALGSLLGYLVLSTNTTLVEQRAKLHALITPQRR